MSNSVDKKNILEFLQKKKLDLYKQIPGFVDAELIEEKNKVKLLVKVGSDLAEKPSISFKGKNIPIKIETVGGGGVLVNSVIENSPIEHNQNAKNDVFKVALLPNEEAINPNSSSPKNRASYEAWKKRHNIKTSQ